MRAGWTQNGGAKTCSTEGIGKKISQGGADWGAGTTWGDLFALRDARRTERLQGYTSEESKCESILF